MSHSKGIMGNHIVLHILIITMCQLSSGTFFNFGNSYDDGYSAPSYNPPTEKPTYNRPSYSPIKNYGSNILSDLRALKAAALRNGANGLRAKGNLFNRGAAALDNTADNISPQRQQQLLLQQQQNLRLQQLQALQQQNLFTQPSYGYNNNVNNIATNNNIMPSVSSDVDTFPLDARAQPQPQPDSSSSSSNTDPGLLDIAEMEALKKLKKSQRQQAPKIQFCEEKLTQLVGDIFIGNEVVPDVLDRPPLYPLDLTYRTVRTFPGMRVTAETTRYKPMVHWPAEDGALYTLVVSNLDINTRKNRTLAEFYHWFVANIPGDSVDDGDVIFDLLFPLVLPEGSGDHRFGYFVMKQPGFLTYQDEGGPTDACSSTMTKGRGPRRSTKNLMAKYDLELTAATFLIIESDEASLEIACNWQKCMGGRVFVRNLDC